MGTAHVHGSRKVMEVADILRCRYVLKWISLLLCVAVLILGWGTGITGSAMEYGDSCYLLARPCSCHLQWFWIDPGVLLFQVPL